MSATHASPRKTNSPQPRYRQRRYRKRATSHLHSTQAGLFSSSPPTYFTPATPKYLGKLYTLHGGRIVPDLLTAQLILVNSLDDRLIPRLYIDKVVVYDCAWVEESFVKGYMMDLKGFAILPWEYDGQAGWIPKELISGLGSPDVGPPWTSLTSERLEKTDEAEGGHGPHCGSNRADPGLEDSATEATQQLVSLTLNTSLSVSSKYACSRPVSGSSRVRPPVGISGRSWRGTSPVRAGSPSSCLSDRSGRAHNEAPFPRLQNDQLCGPGAALSWRPRPST